MTGLNLLIFEEGQPLVKETGLINNSWCTCQTTRLPSAVKYDHAASSFSFLTLPF